jgi:putative membrane protein
MKNYLKLCFSIFIAAVWLFNSISPVLADEANATKEEVIYVNLDDDGSIEGIYAVNIFDVAVQTTITDFGLYDWVRPLNTQDKIEQNGDANIIQASPGRLYYEGALKKVEIPWNFDFRYFIDGTEYTAKEIAGKSGSLKIVLDITHNTAANSSFYKHFTLEISFSLNTEKCRDIAADGATQANVGKNKQLTYFVLPGNEKEITISANVKDCEIPGIRINGISLDMDASRPDTDKMLNQIKDLKDGIADLDDGAVDLRDGTLELRDKALDFQKGAHELDKAISNLAEGAQTLDDNVTDLRDGVRELKDGTADLENGSQQLASGLQDISDGADELAGAAAQISSGAMALQNGSKTLSSGATALYQGSAALNSSMNQLNAGASNLAGGAKSLSTNLSTLNSSSGNLKTASNQIGDGLTAAAEATAKLEAGSNNFVVYLTSLTQSNDPTVAVTAQNILDQYQPSLQAGIVQLNGNFNGNGSNLPDVYDQFQTGLDQYCGSVSALASGSSTLASSATQVAGGVNAAAQGVSQLSMSAQALAAGAGSLDTGLETLATGSQQLQVGLETFYAGTATAVYYGNELKKGARDLNEGAAKLDGGVEALKEAGTTELRNGTKKLKDNTVDLIDATNKLYNGSCELSDGSVVMSLGTRELRDMTSNLDSQFTDKIDEIFNNITGGKWSPVSFVSEKNTHLKSVQFVIKTNGIEIEETTFNNTSTDSNKGFWQRLWNVFTLKKE